MNADLPTYECSLWQMLVELTIVICKLASTAVHAYLLFVHKPFVNEIKFPEPYLLDLIQ